MSDDKLIVWEVLEANWYLDHTRVPHWELSNKKRLRTFRTEAAARAYVETAAPSDYAYRWDGKIYGGGYRDDGIKWFFVAPVVVE
jgi:hypothetical protein